MVISPESTEGPTPAKEATHFFPFKMVGVAGQDKKARDQWDVVVGILKMQCLELSIPHAGLILHLH